jgi:hypothetical protein
MTSWHALPRPEHGCPGHRSINSVHHIFDVLGSVADCSPVLAGVGESDRASLPLGNGEVCANVWVQSDGLHFYLARSDALTELDRTVKLGEYVVSITPNPFEHARSIRQELNLPTGHFEVSAKTTDSTFRAVFFIDSQSDAAFLRIESNIPRAISVETRFWRTASRGANAPGTTLWGDEDPTHVPDIAAVTESADVLQVVRDGVLLHHHNGESVVASIARLHGLADVLDVIPDLIIGRTFGTFTSVDRAADIVGGRITVSNATALNVRVATFSSQTGDALEHCEALRLLTWDASVSQSRTAKFWAEYWTRSWITVTGDTPRVASSTDEVSHAAARNKLPVLQPSRASPITVAYTLSKWMIACGSRGAMPMKYNGGLFTTMPGAGRHFNLDAFGEAFTAPPLDRPTLDLNPDERSWSVENLWQNMRLPYFTLLAQGDSSALLTLFSYFRRFWMLDRARARTHYGAEGQWNTEMTLSCGLQSPGIYGTDRSDVPDGYAKNRWGGAINLSPGLELCKLQFDYWRFTHDDDFLVGQVIPYALDLVDFARTYYYRTDPDRIEFSPMNSLETYFDTTNPVAVVAGYQRLVRDLTKLPLWMTDRQYDVEKFGALLPEIPLEEDANGLVTIAPAQEYHPERVNVESPELYCLAPFDLRESFEPKLLHDTWDKCLKVSGAFRPRVIGEVLGAASYAGWQYLAPVAAMLGLVDVAAHALENNVALSNPGHIFPAMWGPVYDAVPDIDHGANIVNTLQLIVAECVRDARVLESLPMSWRIEFRVFSETGEPQSGCICERRVSLRPGSS